MSTNKKHQKLVCNNHKQPEYLSSGESNCHISPNVLHSFTVIKEVAVKAVARIKGNVSWQHSRIPSKKAIFVRL